MSDAPGPARRILMVDDERSCVPAMRRLFARAGYTLIAVGSAEEALTRTQTETFDAVLLDVSLPGMTGLEAITELGRRSDAPVFVMSGHSDDEMKKDALLLGAAGFFRKPLDFKEAVAAMDRAVDAGRAS